MKFFIEPRSLGVGLLVGAAAGSLTVVECIRRDLIPHKILKLKRPPELIEAKPVTPVKTELLHPALKYGAPHAGSGNHSIRFFDGFVAAFDSRTRNPSWVLEHLYWYDDPPEPATRSKSQFFEDEEIETRFRNRLEDFQGSGYDRGHLAPAANHKKSQKAMNETFTLTNISPQVGRGFNQDYWARFEKFTRDLVKLSSAVFIVTGPLWMPTKQKSGQYVMNYPMIGKPPALVSVPTHFYKVILVEPKDHGDCAVGAFVMPNQSIPADMPLTRFAVPLTDLEAATGLSFFPTYLSEDRKESVDRGSLVWRSIGKAIYGKSNVHLLQTLEESEENKSHKEPPVREKHSSSIIEGKKAGHRSYTS
eukprot:g7858.t2